jgi:CubicO group peptidase (beta-lactamase class C family)
MTQIDIPDWVSYPERAWRRISPAEAGFDANSFHHLVSEDRVEGAAWEGEIHEGNDWGAVVTRGGYLVHSWGDPEYTFQTASVGKTFTRALIGLAKREGLIHEDDPIRETWTGAGQLSHPHKYLTEGHHTTLFLAPSDRQGGRHQPALRQFSSDQWLLLAQEGLRSQHGRVRQRRLQQPARCQR